MCDTIPKVPEQDGSKDMIFLYNNMVFRKPSVFVNR